MVGGPVIKWSVDLIKPPREKRKVWKKNKRKILIKKDMELSQNVKKKTFPEKKMKIAENSGL